MISNPETISIQGYIAIDLHKEYVFIGGMNEISNGPFVLGVSKWRTSVIGLTRT